jgi:hypothetical protein
MGLALLTAGVVAFMTSAWLELDQVVVFLGAFDMAIALVFSFELCKAGMSVFWTWKEQTRKPTGITLSAIYWSTRTGLVVFSVFCSTAIICSQLYDTEGARNKLVSIVTKEYDKKLGRLEKMCRDDLANLDRDIKEELRTGDGPRYKSLVKRRQEKARDCIARQEGLDDDLARNKARLMNEDLGGELMTRNANVAKVSDAFSRLFGTQVPYDLLVVSVAVLIALLLEGVIASAFGFVTLFLVTRDTTR